MTLYVDNVRTPYGRMLLSHMAADTPEELERARIQLGLPISAVHNAGTEREHIDLSAAKRREAIDLLGAVPVTPRDLVKIRQKRRAITKHRQDDGADNETAPSA